MWRGVVCALAFSPVGCFSSGTQLGIVSEDSINSRYLRLKNASLGYVVFRVIAPDAEPLLTPVMPPGGQAYFEMLSRFGTLCPDSLHVEIAAYARAHPETSPLEDWSFVEEPYAAVGIDMVPTRDYGCTADVSLVSIDNLIDCVVLDVDSTAGAIGFRAGSTPSQWQTGVQLADPPPVGPPDLFDLCGRVIDLAGEPLAGVEIYLPQLDASVFTDADGRFAIPLPTGGYVVEPVVVGGEVSPAYRSFSHMEPDEVPIEFVVTWH
jgi:hypothetical protein